MKSKIYIEDLALNKDKRLMENGVYYRAAVIHPDGSATFACFTEIEMQRAIDRGSKNLEDNPSVKSWFAKLFGN